MSHKSTQHILTLASSMLLMVNASMLFWTPASASSLSTSIVHVGDIRTDDSSAVQAFKNFLPQTEKPLTDEYIKAQIAFHISVNQSDEAKKWYDKLLVSQK